MAAFNEIIHQSTRLRVMAALSVLAADERMEFTILRDHLGLTDGNLGAHFAKLEAHGYVCMDKCFVQRKPVSYLQLTPEGRAAFSAHLEALQAILDSQEP